MEKLIPVIIFLGAPGAGKGTQAAYLSLRKSIPRISTGDMLRHAVQSDSELGRKVKDTMRVGKLVDDETMLRLMEERISRPDCGQGFILDGYPRNLKQAAQLETVLPPHMKLQAIEIEAPEEEIVKRVVGRRTCPTCEHIYNVYFHPPKSDQVCDLDGALLFQRNDDTEEVVRRRWATYQKETSPLISHYQNKGVLRVINGVQPEEQVATEIVGMIE